MASYRLRQVATCFALFYFQVTTKILKDIQILLINFKFIAYGQLSLDGSVNIFNLTRYTVYTKAPLFYWCNDYQKQKQKTEKTHLTKMCLVIPRRKVLSSRIITFLLRYKSKGVCVCGGGGGGGEGGHIITVYIQV